jgi:hypothetical protein
MCGYTDVKKTPDGRYRCAVCGKYMGPLWEAWVKQANLPLPK